MANIKAIICPQCGSTQATHLDENKFRCDNCRTAFYIDSENSRVRVKHSSKGEIPVFDNKIKSVSATKILGIIGIVVAGLFLGLIVMPFLFNKNGKNPDGELFNTESFDMIKRSVVTLDNGEPRVFIITENRVKGDNSKVAISLKKYNPADKKFLQKAELVAPVSHTEFSKSNYSDHELFVIGDLIWYINGKSRIFAVNPDSLEIEQTNASIAAQFKELASGIGNVEKSFLENGFKFQNNNGEIHFYFPLENKIYSEAEYKKARVETKNNQLSKRYSFAEPFADVSRNKINKLYEIKKFENSNGPDETCYDCIRLSSPINPKPHTYNDKVKEFREFTPERNYFDGSVLFNDETEVLISFRQTANENEASVLQSLDADGRTKWTLKTDGISNRKMPLAQNTAKVFKLGEILYIYDTYSSLAIDKDGKLLWGFDILSREEWK